MRNTPVRIITIAATVLCLGGCGNTNEEKELAGFSASISEFTTSIKEADNQINSIDPTSETASADLLAILDTLDAEFQELAELTVPEQYKSIEELADEASTNMTNAVSYYHRAYEAEAFDADEADIAYQYYTRAMTRVQYIGYILVGEIPEGESITVHEEMMENTLLDKLLHDEVETIEGVPIE